MQALVYHGPRQLELEEMAAPEPAPGEALVRVLGCGVCGSDLHGYLGHSKARVPPLVLGHEVTGEVIAVADAADGDLVGRRVCVQPLRSCGACGLCLAGRENLCRSRRLMGLNAPGGLAEVVAVPAGNLVPLPAGTTADAAVIEVLANAIHVVGLAGGAESIAIAGGGCLGLLTVLVARESGVRTVVLTEPSAERRDAAATLGATATADPRETALDVLVRRHAPEGADVAVDAVGLTATRQDAIAAAATGGSVVLLGLEHESSEIDFADVIRRELRLLGSFAYTPAEFEAAVELYLRDAARIDPLVHREPLDRGADVFAGLADRRDTRVKVVLIPPARGFDTSLPN
jgi:2-desacetyl-2-hydroxyethyl bacteriochlorophyllide A dehydrogenase